MHALSSLEYPVRGLAKAVVGTVFLILFSAFYVVHGAAIVVENTASRGARLSICTAKDSILEVDEPVVLVFCLVSYCIT